MGQWLEAKEFFRPATFVFFIVGVVVAIMILVLYLLYRGRGDKSDDEETKIAKVEL